VVHTHVEFRRQLVPISGMRWIAWVLTTIVMSFEGMYTRADSFLARGYCRMGVVIHTAEEESS